MTAELIWFAVIFFACGVVVGMMRAEHVEKKRRRQADQELLANAPEKEGCTVWVKEAQGAGYVWWQIWIEDRADVAHYLRQWRRVGVMLQVGGQPSKYIWQENIRDFVFEKPTVGEIICPEGLSQPNS